jgi:ribosomal protein L31E
MLNGSVFTYRVLKALRKPAFKKTTQALDRSVSDSIISNGMDKPEQKQRLLFLRFEFARFWSFEYVF